jgi:hypothetical protein
MAAQKSNARGRRVSKSGRAPVPGLSGESVHDGDRRALLEDLSAQLALVETASIALQKFEDQQEIGAICTSLEHAVSRLAAAHERVGRFLLREQS